MPNVQTAKKKPASREWLFRHYALNCPWKRLRKRWVKNSLSFAVVCRGITNLSAVATAFISLRLYNLYLTKEVYGSVLVAVQFMSYLPLVSGGFGMVLGQQMLASQDREVIGKTARFSQILQSHILLIAWLVAIVLMAVYSQTPTVRSTGLPLPLFFAIGLAGVATFYGGGQIGIMTGLGRQIETIIMTGIWGILGVVLLWIGFLLGFGVWAMPFSTAFGIILLLPVAWSRQRKVVPKLPILCWQRDAEFWPKLKSVWSPSMSWLQAQFSIMMLFTMDIILMGLFFRPGTSRDLRCRFARDQHVAAGDPGPMRFSLAETGATTGSSAQGGIDEEGRSLETRGLPGLGTVPCLPRCNPSSVGW